MKKAGVATADPVAWGQAQENDLLGTYYSPPGAPPGKPFFLPFRSPEREFWKNPKYSGGVLQRARTTDKFEDALNHPTPRKAVERAMRTEATEITDDVRGHVAGQMAVVRKSFIKGFTAKVLAKDPNRLPALYVGSRIPWSGMHETGGPIAGRMPIPLHGRFRGRQAPRARRRHSHRRPGAQGGAQEAPERRASGGGPDSATVRSC